MRVARGVERPAPTERDSLTPTLPSVETPRVAATPRTAEQMLELQRTIGNRAAAPRIPGRVLGRQSRPRRAPPAFQIVVATVGRNRLTRTVRETAMRVVRGELRHLAAGSQDAVVRRGFRTRQHVGALRNTPADLGSRTYVCYLVGGDRPVDEAVSLAVRHLGLPQAEVARVRTFLDGQFRFTGGGTVDWGDHSVSFVATAAWDRLLSFQGAFPASVRPARERGIGVRLGELILHELGHGMGADHVATGIMREGAAFGDLTVPQQHFSAASATDIRTRLEGIARGPASPP